MFAAIVFSYRANTTLYMQKLCWACFPAFILNTLFPDCAALANANYYNIITSTSAATRTAIFEVIISLPCCLCNHLTAEAAFHGGFDTNSEMVKILQSGDISALTLSGSLQQTGNVSCSGRVRSSPGISDSLHCFQATNNLGHELTALGSILMSSPQP